jgi:hypothetical protein
VKSAKKLTLKKETLSSLTGDELDGLAGAGTTTTTLSRFVQPCVSDLVAPCNTSVVRPICPTVSAVIQPGPTDFC